MFRIKPNCLNRNKLFQTKIEISGVRLSNLKVITIHFGARLNCSHFIDHLSNHGIVAHPILL